MSREAQNPQMYIWAHQKRSKSGLVSGPWEQTSLNIEFQWPRSCVHPFASLQLTPLPEMSDCQGQSNLKQRSKQLILLLSTSSFLQILKLRGHAKKGRVCYPVMQFRGLLRETATGQHVLGKGLLIVGEAGDCHL